MKMRITGRFSGTDMMIGMGTATAPGKQCIAMACTIDPAGDLNYFCVDRKACLNVTAAITHRGGDASIENQ